MSEPVLRLVGISKRFPGVLANDNVDFELAPGEIHALLGENGAGKTTLMNVVYGLYKQDEGQIFIDGRQVEIHDPNDALARGIGMVHQHFMLVPVMTVTENMMLGHETTRGLRLGLLSDLDPDRVAEEIKALGDKHGLSIDPEAYVRDLSVGEEQRVEIVKALYRGAEVLILDEPTAVLTPQEAEDLFGIMRSLIAEGKSIIFITHKLKEVLVIADRITVLRDGRVVGTTEPSKTTEAELAAMMVGREVILQVEKGPAAPGEAVLEVQDLQVRDLREQMAIRGVSFTVRAGEIFGIAGVQGNGQAELVEALTGLTPVEGGHIFMNGQETTHLRPRAITETGIAHVPEDRHKHGLVLVYPLDENLVLQTYYLPPFAKRTFLQPKEVRENAIRLIQEFDVRTPSVRTHAGSLSGGNQQKVIVARELSRDIRLLIANQPTRGLDVGSIEFIHRRIVEKRDEGVGVLLVSSELDEILGLSDRIAVMYAGEILAVMPAEEATKERLGLLMAGVREAPDSIAAD
ncbi:MAG: ABC transporter ATP-binding protein [Chloroflexi bacterium]|nr:ABC transporter ATP-binding protein [Chloroflexota bacterium]MDK1046023.1 ABC transporter ATP-binding protein [Anaerolineales bacterium]